MSTTLQTPQSLCRCGVARADITPPIGIYHRMWGAATHERAAGVHRPLLATCLAFRPWDESASEGTDEGQLLLALDHCVMGREEIARLKSAITASTGFPEPSISIIFSHTHAAGLMLLDRRSLPGGEKIPDYIDSVAETAAGLAAEALEGARPVTISYARGRCDLARHRDFWDEESDQYVCGLNPDGDADDTVLVGRVVDGEGTTIATTVNYACHPTTLSWGNQLISPDYPGAMREVVEQFTAAPCVFIQGAAGDLGPRDGFVGDVEVADRNGRQLGFAALSALESLPPPRTQIQYRGPVVSGATIGVWEHAPVDDQRLKAMQSARFERWEKRFAYIESLPTAEAAEQDREHWLEQENAAREAGDEVRFRDCRARVERGTRLLARLKTLPGGGDFPLGISAWKLGDAVWLTIPGEPYHWLQTELRRRFPDNELVIATVANEWGASYLPPRDLYGAGVYQESIAVLAPGCLEKLVDDIDGHLRQLLDR